MIIFFFNANGKLSTFCPQILGFVTTTVTEEPILSMYNCSSIHICSVNLLIIFSFSE